MAIRTPWLTSSDLIETVKRRIMVPVSEVTFSDDDILNFANDELMGSQIASVLQYHEEYFIETVKVPLQPNITKYPIPSRALGMKLRSIFFEDTNGQLYDMTRVNLNDQAFFLNTTTTANTPYRYFVENNNIVLSVTNLSTPTGNLIMGFYIRPNQLVANDQAAIIKYFQKTITIDNNAIVPGDTLTISNPTTKVDTVFTAVASSASINEFVIGANSINTATNLVNAINTNQTYSATNGTPSINQVTIPYYDINIEFLTSNSTAIVIPTTQTIFSNSVPTTFENNSYYDILQTKPGHKIINYDVLVGNNAISGNTMTFSAGSLPRTVVVGDYICQENLCIIPQLPTELHNILAERTCSRILSALGDTEALQTVNSKIEEMELRQGNMIDNRVEGNPQKVLPRRSILAYSKVYRRNIL